MQMCSQILDVVQSIYVTDPANYFILDSDCTLGKFVEVIHTKSREVQVKKTNIALAFYICFQTKIFDIIEFIVYNLCHVPCKEFIALCVVMKTQK